MAVKRIIIVDDTMSVGRLVESTLTTLGGDLSISVVPSAEEALLRALAERPGEVLDRETLGAGAGARAVDVQITRLRRKIEPDPRRPRYLLTVRGEGYSLRADGGAR